MSARRVLLLAALTALATACLPQPVNFVPPDGGDGGGSDIVSPGTCPTNPPVMMISGEITANTTWTCQNAYELTEVVYVRNNSTLRIEPGTTVRGQARSALVITRGSRIRAAGEATRPIVFTSSKMPGTRGLADWGGLVLLGNATVNISGAPNDAGVSTTTGQGFVEGLPRDERATYGGGASPDDASDCGQLRYVRVEFAGFAIADGNELNGITLGGCGASTEVDFVQVHRATDDGIEVFGGAVNLRHVVVSGAQDDGLDWDFGWTGSAQFLVVQHDTSMSDNGFEGDNSVVDPNAQPRSRPTIYNATLVGRNVAATTGYGMLLRRGTSARIFNTIVTSFSAGALRIPDMDTQMQTAPPGDLTVANSLFFAGAAGTLFPDAMSMFERTFAADAMRTNRLDMDPMLGDPLNVTAPNFVPAAGSPAVTGAATPTPAGLFDATATYVGAFPPGATTLWTAGWTAFPVN